MFDYIKGTLVKKQPTLVIVDTHGLGYFLKISLSTYQNLPEVGNEVVLKTYLHVREDILQLYGFSSEGEREIFTALLSISGIGPKLAQTILSGLTPERFIKAIRQEDERTLNSISGVGKKTAQRLLVELKDKLKSVDIEFEGDEKFPLQTLGSIGEEALMALMSLGYSRHHAEKAIIKVSESGNSKTVEEMIKAALQVI